MQLTDAWDLYRPHIAAVLAGLLPVAALAWIVVSGMGRSLVLSRMDPGLRFRPFLLRLAR